MFLDYALLPASLLLIGDVIAELLHKDGCRVLSPEYVVIPVINLHSPEISATVC